MTEAEQTLSDLHDMLYEAAFSDGDCFDLVRVLVKEKEEALRERDALKAKLAEAEESVREVVRKLNAARVGGCPGPEAYKNPGHVACLRVAALIQERDALKAKLAEAEEMLAKVGTPLCLLAEATRDREDEGRERAEKAEELRAIGSWLDGWMETTGEDFPKRGQSLHARVCILAHICHSHLSSSRTAERICLEQQKKCSEAERMRDDLKAKLIEAEDQAANTNGYQSAARFRERAKTAEHERDALAAELVTVRANSKGFEAASLDSLCRAKDAEVKEAALREALEEIGNMSAICGYDCGHVGIHKVVGKALATPSARAQQIKAVLEAASNVACLVRNLKAMHESGKDFLEELVTPDDIKLYLDEALDVLSKAVRAMEGK